MRFYSDAKSPFGLDGDDDAVISPAAAKYIRAGGKKDFTHFFRYNRSPRGIGLYPSRAMQVSFPYFSAFELVLLQFLDITIGAKFWPQPPSFKIVVEGEPRTYTPDCGVLFETERYMIETKYRAHAEQPKHMVRWPGIRTEIAACGYTFKILDEEKLRNPTFEQRIQGLQQHRGGEITEFQIFLLEDRLFKKPVWRLDEVLALIADLGLRESIFWTLIIRRKLYIDLWGEINEATEIFHARSAPFPPIFLEDEEVTLRRTA